MKNNKASEWDDQNIKKNNLSDEPVSMLNVLWQAKLSRNEVEFREINPLLPKECIVTMNQNPNTDSSISLSSPLILSSAKKFAVFLILISSISLTSLLASYSAIETPEDKILAKGFSSYMDGNDKQALSYFEEVIRINPHNSAAQKGLEKVKVRLKKLEEENKRKSRELAKAKYNEGREMMRSGDIVGAIDAYQAAVEAVPAHSPAKAELADIKKKMNRLSDRKKLNISTYSFARGVVAYLEKDWAKAWRIWSERLQLEPNDVVLANATARAEKNFKRMMLAEQEDFFRRGARAFYEQGLYKEAQSSWVKVLALRVDDVEALEGKARSEEAILRAEGKGKDNQLHDLLEQGLEYYASQNWRKSLQAFQQIASIDPEFSTAKEYIAKLNRHLAAPDYIPTSVSQGESWRASKPSNQGNESAQVADDVQNFSVSRKELESQLKRNPNDITIQQKLDNVTRAQQEESERIYKDGLIAYSQGNRAMAIQQWKQVLIVDPEHKKAAAALRKARAEEERAPEVTETP